jgi:hypothetical protein
LEGKAGLSEKVCLHPSIDTELADLLTSADIEITVAEMSERTLLYLAETVCRVKYPERDSVETTEFFIKLKRDAAPANKDAVVFASLREIHEYLKTIPKLERWK